MGKKRRNEKGKYSDVKAKEDDVNLKMFGGVHNIEENVDPDIELDFISAGETVKDRREALRDFIYKSAKDISDSKDRLSSLILYNLIEYIDETIDTAKEVLDEYTGIERKFMPKLYPRELIAKEAVRPICLIRGSDRVDHIEFMNSLIGVLDTGIEIINNHENKYKNIQIMEQHFNNMIKGTLESIRNDAISLVAKEHIRTSIDKMNDEIDKSIDVANIPQTSKMLFKKEYKESISHVVYNTFVRELTGLIGNSEVLKQIYEEIVTKKVYNAFLLYYKAFIDTENSLYGSLEMLRDFVLSFHKKWKVKFDPPTKASIDASEEIRSLLTRTHKLGRRTELLCAYFLSEILAIHPQVRKDYQDLERYTNRVYKNLIVTKGIVKMSGGGLAQSFKRIIRALKNIQGDMETLKIIINVLMRPKEDIRQAATLLHKIMAQRRGGSIL